MSWPRSVASRTTNRSVRSASAGWARPPRNWLGKAEIPFLEKGPPYPKKGYPFSRKATFLIVKAGMLWIALFRSILKSYRNEKAQKRSKKQCTEIGNLQGHGNGPSRKDTRGRRRMDGPTGQGSQPLLKTLQTNLKRHLWSTED